MNKYCPKCRTKNLTIFRASQWENKDPFMPTELNITFECSECGETYSEKIFFNSLNEYLDFLEDYKK